MQHVYRDPFRDQNPAAGTWCRAVEYYELLRHVLGTFDPNWPIQPKYHYPLFMNLGHALELGLKAYLLSQAVKWQELRKIGHRLSRLFEMALELGLADRCAVGDADLQVVDLISEPFRKAEFRYAEHADERNFPGFATVLRLVHRILAGIANDCDPRGGAATRLSEP